MTESQGGAEGNEDARERGFRRLGLDRQEARDAQVARLKTWALWQTNTAGAAAQLLREEANRARAVLEGRAEPGGSNRREDWLVHLTLCDQAADSLLAEASADGAVGPAREDKAT